MFVSLLIFKFTIYETIISVEQATLWSDWMPTVNSTGNGIVTEKRTRFICTIGSSKLPEIKLDIVSYRVCREQRGIDCQEIGRLINDI